MIPHVGFAETGLLRPPDFLRPGFGAGSPSAKPTEAFQPSHDGVSEGPSEMARGVGAAALVSGVLGAIAGIALRSVCTLSLGTFCLQYGYADTGLLLMIFGGVLFIVGVILLALSEKTAQGPAPDYSAPPQVVHREPKAVRSDQKFCPTCGQWYRGDYKLCLRDGSGLKVAQ